MDSRQLNRIQELRWRKDIDISLRELSRRSGVSTSALSRIENEISIPNQIQMIEIARAFDLPVSEVFNLDWRGYL